MNEDIHDIIARAEQRPGNAVSIDPPDSLAAPCKRCGESWEDHIRLTNPAGKTFGSFCPDGFAEFDLPENRFTDLDDDDDDESGGHFRGCDGENCHC